MVTPGRVIGCALFLLAAVFPIIGLSGQRPAIAFDGKYSGKQGQILVVKVPTDEETARVQGTFLGRAVLFFPETRSGEAKGFVGLLGIDLQDVPGTHDLTIQIMQREHSRSLVYRVEVVKEKFRVEHLKLPKDKVDLDEQGLARWKAEQEQVKEALATDSQSRLWQPSFVEPVSGKRTGIFGSVRIMNGQARNPHNGEDIGAPTGTDVAATNDGIVRLTVEHIFSGKGVFLDHGLGFYSMYFHLSEVLVKEGEAVKAGQIVGKVGATGRATGPHLHWGVKLNGARVNPYALLDLPFKAEAKPVIPTPDPDSDSAVGAPAP
ncbi:MAG: M23 family metallopeptidase [Nitrospira sp.]|nr:M23 family metallopeptidase [Nitrospira sp.]